MTVTVAMVVAMITAMTMTVSMTMTVTVLMAVVVVLMLLGLELATRCCVDGRRRCNLIHRLRRHHEPSRQHHRSRGCSNAIKPDSATTVTIVSTVF